MTIELSPEVEQLLPKKVGGGAYASADEVLHLALLLLEEHDQFLEMQREEIRIKIEEARQSLDRGETVDGEEVFDRLFKELDVIEQHRPL